MTKLMGGINNLSMLARCVGSATSKGPKNPHVIKDVETPEEFLRYQGNTPLPPIHYGDVGYDLYCSETTYLGPNRGSKLNHIFWLLGVDALRMPQRVQKWAYSHGSFAHVPTGTSVEMPEGIYGTILPRSSSNSKGLLVLTGIIDHGYRGPLFTMVYNMTNREIVIEKGDRISQLVLYPMYVYKTETTDRFSSTDRGTNGFGSTGK